ncbi:MAG: hypothetical protein HQ521_05220 [Bacteroidetes bacterium]|nr:hypothetical protein [Bacteroidota bacterium]
MIKVKNIYAKAFNRVNIRLHELSKGEYYSTFTASEQSLIIDDIMNVVFEDPDYFLPIIIDCRGQLFINWSTIEDKIDYRDFVQLESNGDWDNIKSYLYDEIVDYLTQLDKLIESLNELCLQSNEHTIKSFKWIGSQEELSTLYKILEPDIISTDLNTFLQAFGNIILNAPLNIKWVMPIKRNKNKSQVRSIFNLLHALQKKGKIDSDDIYTNAELTKDKAKYIFKQIKHVFADIDGQTIESLATHKSRAIRDSKTADYFYKLIE